LFDTYARALEPLRRLVEGLVPRRPEETEAAYDRRIRSQYVDSCRYLLPAASLANLGMTANARVLERALCKMLSHPLVEVRQVGEEVKRVALAEVPTLVKYAEAVPYLVETCVDLSRAAPRGKKKRTSTDWCQLVDFDSDGEDKVLAAALFHFGGLDFNEALKRVKSASAVERKRIADALLGRLGPHDIPLRELEYSAYTFDLILDQGAYAEFKRHRMMTQTPQALTARLGYAVPQRIADAGFEAPYRAAMETAAETYEKLAAWNPQVAAYVVPNGFKRRVLFRLNLREAFAFCQLRSAPNAHFAMRRVALRVAEEIRRVHPALAKFLSLPEETWQSLEEQFFKATT
jgi:thymidylate synthase ThyX